MKNRILLTAIALVAVAVWGCAKPAAPPVTSSTNTTGPEHDHEGHDHEGHDHEGHDHDHAETTAVSLMYCGSCGHSFAKDAKHTCDGDHAKCEACGLHKGSELCCKIEGDFAGKALCGKCGQVAGTDACCQEGADVCQKCSLHKGSPLCCKLGGEAAPAEEAPAAPAEAEAAPAEEAPAAPAEAEAAPAAEETTAEPPAAPEKAAEEAPAEAAPAKEGEG